MATSAGKVDRRQVVRSLSSGVVGAALAAPLAGSAAVAEAARPAAGKSKGWHRKGIYPETVPAADAFYSPAILASGRQLLFVSGQGPEDLDADMETQIRQTFQRIETVLETAGAGWSNVVLIRSFFVHLQRDLPLFRQVRKEFLVQPYPASTAVGTTELAIAGLEIEFEALAVLGRGASGD